MHEKDGTSTQLLASLDDKDKNMRLLAVKNIGKLKSIQYLEKLYNIANNDESTIVRREAVSSIGRMRCVDAIPYLIEMLYDEDPKIACQAIRGLLIFKGNSEVDLKLKAYDKS